MNGKAQAERVATLAFVITFAVLIANGRAIGSGDTNAMEKTATSLAERRTFVLTGENPSDPFTRAVPGGRISIYPALPALLAAPFFAAFGLFFDLDAAGIQIAGKATAAFIAALATAFLARAFARRTTSTRALGAALLFGLGTSVFSTAQALWQHPFAVLFLVMAIEALEETEALAMRELGGTAARAGLCLALAAACRPALIPMAAILFIYLLTLVPAAFAARIVLIAAIPTAAVLWYNQMFFGSPWRFGPAIEGRFFGAFPESLLGLLISPARGLLIFTPLAALAGVALAREARQWPLARALAAAVGVHFLFIAAWNEWHGGESFGPRLLTDLLPPLFFFLPEALALAPALGALLGAVSIGVQLIGGWTYDYRWERLHQRGREFDSALWSWSEAPIPFALREGVVIQGIPDLEGTKLRLRLRRFVPLGSRGSSIEGTPTGLRITGDPLIRDIRLERGGRVDGSWIVLSHPNDALAFRVEAPGSHELHLSGSLQGRLRVEAGSSVSSLPASGPFDLRIPVRSGAFTDVAIRADSGEMRLARVDVR